MDADIGLQTLFRVWDVFLVDGLDVLFRVALAILKANEDELLQCDSIPAVYVALESLPNRMWRPDKLLKVRSVLLSTMATALMPPIISARSRTTRHPFTF